MTSLRRLATVSSLVLVLLVPAPALAASPNAAPAGGLTEAGVTANNLIELGPGDYAIQTIPHGAPSGKMKRVPLTLPGGTKIAVDIDTNASVNLIAPSAGGSAYVPALDPNIAIHNEYDELPGEDANGVPNSINKRIEKTGTANVIVTMNLPFKNFYLKSDTAAARANKQAQHNAAKAAVQAAMGAGGKIKLDLKVIGGFSATIDAQALKGLVHNPNVAKISLNQVSYLQLFFSVPHINAPLAWQSPNPNPPGPWLGTGVKVAIMDSGVDYTRPDLGGCFGPKCKVVGGWDFVDDDADPMDTLGHGTAVAAIAAGVGLAGSVKLLGVAPGASILAYRVADNTGRIEDGVAIAAIDRAIQDGAGVINLSFGVCNRGPILVEVSGPLGCPSLGYNYQFGPTDARSDAVNAASAAGVAVAVAAGNEGPNATTIMSPGVAASAITVANACPPNGSGDSQCSSGPVSESSSRGPVVYEGVDYQKPDISAPGSLICAARSTTFSLPPLAAVPCFDQFHVELSGTSFASPHVAGVLALMKQAYPASTPAQLKSALKASATSLGLPYNVQGAGMVNMQGLVPSTSKRSKRTSNDPAIWYLDNVPSTRYSSNSQTFSVDASGVSLALHSGDTRGLAAVGAAFSSLALAASGSSLSITFTSPDPGITFSSDKASLNFSQGTTAATFTGTVTVDNDVTEPGFYIGDIILKDSAGTEKGDIPVLISVGPSYSISVGALDYGVDDPELGSWTSATKSLTVTNLRTDKSQTITFTPGPFTSGGGVPLSASAAQFTPTTVTVPAGGSVAVPTRVVVPSNSAVDFGTYDADVAVSNGSYTTRMRATFKKFYVLNIVSSVTPASIILTGEGLGDTAYLDVTDTTTTAYLYNKGAYSIIVDYQDTLDGQFNEHTVFKEGFYLTGGVTDININPSMATHKIGAITPPAQSETVGMYLMGPGFSGDGFSSLGFSVVNDNVTNDPGYRFVSDMSSNFHYLLSNTSLVSSNASSFDVYTLGNFQTNGVSGDSVINPSPDQYQALTAEASSLTGSPRFNLTSWSGVSYGSNTYFTTKMTKELTSPASATVHWYPNAQGSSEARFVATGCSGCGNFFDIESPFITMSPTGFSRQMYYGVSLLLPTMSTTTVTYLGLGPAIWSGKFRNAASQVYAEGYYVTGYGLFMRQDYGWQMYNDMSYTLTKDGVTVKTGTIPGSGVYRSDLGKWVWQYSALNAATPGTGTYQLSFSHPYLSASVLLSADVLATFNNGYTDPNPPSITELTYTTNGTPTEQYYERASQNTLTLGFDPVNPAVPVGGIASVAVSYSTDGSTYVPVTVSTTTTVAGTRYVASIPSGLLAGQTNPVLRLRLLATDSPYGNSLQYTFQLPATTALPPGDGTVALPPTATLLANPATITVGQSSTLTWSSENATSCTGTNFTADTTTGSVVVTPASTTTYTLICSGEGGTSAPVSASVTVVSASAGSASLSASPATVASGQLSTLTWSSINATSCTGSGFSTGRKGALSGSVEVIATTTTTYALTCTGASGSASASATVTVSGSFTPQATVYVTATTSVIAYPKKPQSNTVKCTMYPGDKGVISNFSAVTGDDGLRYWYIGWFTSCYGYVPEKYLSLQSITMAPGNDRALAAAQSSSEDSSFFAEIHGLLATVAGYLGSLAAAITGAAGF